MSSDMIITIAVPTYNSAETVIEALQSICAQTYQGKMELIISDDASIDNTVALCEEWVEKNKHRFVRTVVIQSKENKGVCVNKNNCIYSAQGEWIKFVDGDDLLTSNCIESCLKAVKDGVDFIVGNFILFDEKGKEIVHKMDTHFFDLPIPKQLRLQEKKARILWPGLFLRRSSMIAAGAFDERFPMFDDFPFFLKALENNCRFVCLDEVIFRYRLRSGSVQSFKSFFQSRLDYTRVVLIPKYKRQKRWLAYWHDLLWFNKEVAIIEGKKLKPFLLETVMLLTDPKEWLFVLKHKIYRPLVFKWRARKG